MLVTHEIIVKLSLKAESSEESAGAKESAPKPAHMALDRVRWKLWCLGNDTASLPVLL